MFSWTFDSLCSSREQSSCLTESTLHPELAASSPSLLLPHLSPVTLVPASISILTLPPLLPPVTVVLLCHSLPTTVYFNKRTPSVSLLVCVFFYSVSRRRCHAGLIRQNVQTARSHCKLSEYQNPSSRVCSHNKSHIRFECSQSCYLSPERRRKITKIYKVLVSNFVLKLLLSDQ